MVLAARIGKIIWERSPCAARWGKFRIKSAAALVKLTFVWNSLNIVKTFVTRAASKASSSSVTRSIRCRRRSSRT